MNNNPVRYSDPSGHVVTCGDGEAGTCGGDTAESNYQKKREYYEKCKENPDDPECPQYGEIALFVIASLGLSSADIITSAVISEIQSIVTGILSVLCADGDCTNEIRTGNVTVYQYVENGVTRYIGITNDLARRAAEHLNDPSRGWPIEPIQGLEALSRFDARAVEQVLIESYGLPNLLNQINSIAATNPIYLQAIQRGTQILASLGILH